MAQQTRRKPAWSSLSRVEQVTLVSSILIWAGVVLGGGGLYLAFRGQPLDQAAYGQAAHGQATAWTSTPTATNTPTPTPVVYPVGWSTATPTLTPAPTTTPTSTPEASGIDVGEFADPVMAEVEPTATLVQRVVTTPTPSPVPPDRLAIPAIKLDAPVVPIGWHVVQEGGQRYTVWEVADYAVSWHKTSAYPGQVGNVVLNGHNNIKGEVFRYLVDLEVGDEALLYAGKRTYRYIITEKHILKEKGESPEVRRKNARWIAPTDDERLTMVTCWPYTSNTHRLVIVAKPAPNPKPQAPEE